VQCRITCTVMRGGTSRGLFFHQKDLPEDIRLRDRILLAAFGSPDPKQIDGLGGAVSVTSKAAIIGPPTAPDADVDYTFGQVSITRPLVDYKGNCGNISAAVGPFAIDEGLVEPVEPVTTVRIHNTNTNKIIVAHVPVKNGKADIEGDCEIAGVPGKWAPILIEFESPGGAVTGKLLPTGSLQDEIDLGEDGLYHVSIVDAANPLVFALAEEMGLTGRETPGEIDNDPRVSRILESIRSEACYRLGLVDSPLKATELSPAIPKVAFVAPSGSYRTAEGKLVEKDQMDFLARSMSMQKAHKSFAITGAVCTAVAASLPGTVVHRVARLHHQGKVTFGHPEGLITLEIEIRESGPSQFQIIKAAVERSARRIMDGSVYIPKKIFQEEKR